MVALLRACIVLEVAISINDAPATTLQNQTAPPDSSSLHPTQPILLINSVSGVLCSFHESLTQHTPIDFQDVKNLRLHTTANNGKHSICITTVRPLRHAHQQSHVEEIK